MSLPARGKPWVLVYKDETSVIVGRNSQTQQDGHGQEADAAAMSLTGDHVSMASFSAPLHQHHILERQDVENSRLGS